LTVNFAFAYIMGCIYYITYYYKLGRFCWHYFNFVLLYQVIYQI